jgi:hypothetical protein
METFEVNPKSLNYLLKLIHECALALPDFQRNFVWQPRETEQLIESIAQNYPAGSLLFMAFRPDTFTPRAVENAPTLQGDPLQLVLDGQQRLTSLYQAFYGTGDYRYFIDLNHLISGHPDIEQAVFYKSKHRCGPWKDLASQAEKLVLPLGTLFGGLGFDGWLDEVSGHRPETGPEQAQLRARIREVRAAFIKPLEEYRFPVVTLSHETSLEAVCSIFETLNRTGVRLSVFELLAARYYAKGLDLRKKWQQSQEGGNQIISEFEVDQYYVLQAIALRAFSSVKRGDVLGLTTDQVEEHWEPVIQGFRAALEMLRAECGVLTGKWLPYAYMLVPMAALWKEHLDQHGPNAGGNRLHLKQWFWCAALNARYDRAANSQAAKDFVELRRWFGGGVPPEAVEEFSFDAGRLRAITPRQQSVYKALMSLILRRGVSDFHMGATLTAATIAARAVDDHHVFPKAYLNPSDQPPTQPTELVDSILNRTMIDRITNIRIGKRAPSDYLAEVRNEFEAAGLAISFEDLLATHLMPGDTEAAVWTDDFAAFAQSRQELLATEIERATGRVVQWPTPTHADTEEPLDALV